mmetsp:Transcript_6240/g.8240  ORF Transcript_6240/g.8240 Transcript_6240/m.8240 type:complete len:184 (-) Transcript_6240:203-754(-)|eukprot:CAMPEP_0116057086 /NCGR_PEP_ID=MMETSP0322-20121206/4401_1 /TAXON_ID=163516 /ORGANISM="Leptocylindrus danicus var. apora, Strain B651" /LENGTH=183 /DNA_ID=CAMNT_0003541029 /DNA_START=251 /DNA_END=802 /DNA_ORIENTATION=-
MGTFLKICVWIFVILETNPIVQLWFDRMNDWADSPMFEHGSLAPGTFQAYLQGDDSIRRLVDFFAVWVASHKFMMVMFVLVGAYSSDAHTRLFTCITMLLGSSVYFWQQAGIYDSIYSRQEHDTMTSSQLALTVAGIVIMWIAATVSECLPFLQANGWLSTSNNNQESVHANDTNKGRNSKYD